MQVPHGALVLVLDGAHLQLLRNRGGGSLPDLESVAGAAIRSRGPRSEPDDRPWRTHDVIAALDPMLAGGTPLILIAPAERLGALRAEVPRRDRRNIVAEIGKDLAHCAPHELARRLHLAAA